MVEFAAAGAVDVDHSDSICARVKMLTLMEELGPVKSAGLEVKPTIPPPPLLVGVVLANRH